MTTPTFWFFPTWSGDFRLISEGDDAVVLSIESPTTSEVVTLDALLEHARKEKWIDVGEGYQKEGKSKLMLAAPMNTVGPYLHTLMHKGAETWTAFRSKGGEITIEDGAQAIVKGDTAAAATVKKPARGCPAPEPAARRASEVLRCFSTESQARSFRDNGFMRVIGNSTGMAYNLFHRDEAAKRGLGHGLVEAASGREVCVWDCTVPAEEEVLAVKLAVEHHEAWMLDKSRLGRVVRNARRARRLTRPPRIPRPPRR